MMTHEYETMVILRPDLDDAVTRENVERLETIIAENSGTMLIKDEWGKRKLAYPISNHLKGHYVLFNYLLSATDLLEVERRIRINDNIIRFMTVKLDDDVDVPTRIATAADERARREEEAKRRAEAEAERMAQMGDDYDGYKHDDDDDDDEHDHDDDED